MHVDPHVDSVSESHARQGIGSTARMRARRCCLIRLNIAVKTPEVGFPDTTLHVALDRHRNILSSQIALTLAANLDLYIAHNFSRIVWRKTSVCRPMASSRRMSMNSSKSDELFEMVLGAVPSETLHQQAWWLNRRNPNQPAFLLEGIHCRTTRLKQVMDLTGAAVLFVLLIPVMGLVAVAVRLNSPGPVIFRQVRTGLNQRQSGERRAQINNSQSYERRDRSLDRRASLAFGRPFVLYKFRTMRLDAEKDGAKFAVKGDPRVTKIGRFLRKTRLDELPQIYFIHFWADGPLADILVGLRAALDAAR